MAIIIIIIIINIIIINPSTDLGEICRMLDVYDAITCANFGDGR